MGDSTGSGIRGGGRARGLVDGAHDASVGRGEGADGEADDFKVVIKFQGAIEVLGPGSAALLPHPGDTGGRHDLLCEGVGVDGVDACVGTCPVSSDEIKVGADGVGTCQAGCGWIVAFFRGVLNGDKAGGGEVVEKGDRGRV